MGAATRVTHTSSWKPELSDLTCAVKFHESSLLLRVM